MKTRSSRYAELIYCIVMFNASVFIKIYTLSSENNVDKLT